MLTTFLATLTPMATLFLCIAVGFLVRKTKVLPENAGKVMAKMETWIFCPALGFYTTAKSFTVSLITEHAKNLTLAVIATAVSMGIAIFLARFFVKERSPERGVYEYALTFSNGGYVGDPLVLAIFGTVGLGFYKIYYLPLSIVIYTWGITTLVPSGTDRGGLLKKLCNAPTIALLLGMIVGITGLGSILLPGGETVNFFESTLNSLKSCMGPVAMLLCGFTVAGYDMKHMLLQRKVYIATLLRLFILPAIIVALVYGLKTLANSAFGLSIDNSVLFLTFFSTATPLGMNTIVYPESYGGDPKTGASMALISHTLCVLTIPLLFAVMVALFGMPSF